MGLIYRRRIPLDDTTKVNLSTTGASVSKRLGKRVTVNTRGQVRIRLLKGLSWRLWR